MIEKARDQIPAHGSKGESNVLVRDMYLFQGCSHYEFDKYLNKYYFYYGNKDFSTS
jgi:hypothetical protein